MKTTKKEQSHWKVNENPAKGGGAGGGIQKLKSQGNDSWRTALSTLLETLSHELTFQDLREPTFRRSPMHFTKSHWRLLQITRRTPRGETPEQNLLDLSETPFLRQKSVKAP